MFNGLKKRNKTEDSNMELKNLLFCIIISVLLVNSEQLKVIFARNTTADAVKQAEVERIAREREHQPDTSSIINIPTSCKPGFVYESTFHNRCRRIAG